MTPPAPRTQVNPKGLAKLYLPLDEITPYFQSFLDYCEFQRKRVHRLYWPILAGYGLFFLLFMFFLFDELEFADEDEGGLIIFAIIIGIVIGGAIIGFFVSRLGKVNSLKSKAVFLHAFFQAIRHDLHPESGIKGLIDHREHGSDHVYKTKTSPHSGAKKKYYKYPWARFKFTLVDGTMLVLKCVDKVKEKSSSIVRFIEIQKAEIHYNPLLYSHQQNVLFVRQELAMSLDDFKAKPEYWGQQMLNVLKSHYQALKIKSNAKVPSASKHVVDTVKPAMEPSADASKLETYLHQSHVPDMTYEKQASDQFLVSVGSDKPTSIRLQEEEADGERFVKLTAEIRSPLDDLMFLLRVNPALAYGRFAIEELNGQRRLVLVKTLLYDTLDPEEIDTAVIGLASLGSKLSQMDNLPQKAKAYHAERNRDWEKMLMDNALQGLNSEMEVKENKFKVILPTTPERKQTVHVRFDRKDMEGNQMISILSYCGALNAQLYETCLKQNAHLSYGAIGLGKLGLEEMFVVSDNQLAETADPQELRTAIFQVAHKADRLEKILTGADIH